MMSLGTGTKKHLGKTSNLLFSLIQGNIHYVALFLCPLRHCKLHPILKSQVAVICHSGWDVLAQGL